MNVDINEFNNKYIIFDRYEYNKLDLIVKDNLVEFIKDLVLCYNYPEKVISNGLDNVEKQELEEDKNILIDIVVEDYIMKVFDFGSGRKQLLYKKDLEKVSTVEEVENIILIIDKFFTNPREVIKMLSDKNYSSSVVR